MAQGHTAVSGSTLIQTEVWGKVLAVPSAHEKGGLPAGGHSLTSRTGADCLAGRIESDEETQLPPFPSVTLQSTYLPRIWSPGLGPACLPATSQVEGFGLIQALSQHPGGPAAGAQAHSEIVRVWSQTMAIKLVIIFLLMECFAFNLLKKSNICEVQQHEVQ